MTGDVFSGTLRKRWGLTWLLAVLSIAALPLAWYWWSLERVSARELQQVRTRESVVAPLESLVNTHLAGWKTAQANVASVQEKIKSMGEAPDQWSRRTITIDNQRMSRQEVEKYLRDLTNDERNVLVLNTLSIRAAKPAESVFATHKGQDSPDSLVVIIKADLYTRGAS
jgi:hypothetical protein